MEMNLWSLECFVDRKAWLTGTLLPEASERSRTRRRWLVKQTAMEWNRGGGRRTETETGRSFTVSGSLKVRLNWPVGRGVGWNSRRTRIRWCLVLLFWKETSFRANPSLRGGGGMKCYSPGGQQHSHTSSVLQSHHPFHRVLHSHLTQRWTSYDHRFIHSACTILPLFLAYFI